MKDITYKIEFFSNWHCGSGLAAGADVDELAVKDRDGLPFIPGRTVKGLLRDACDELRQYDGLDDSEIKETFGYFNDNADEAVKGSAFFSDAVLPEADRQTIVQEKLTAYLYQSVSATAIDDKGIAKDFSLRKIQTTVPCVLEGRIMNVPDKFAGSMEKAMKLVKRLGLDRSRGLGRCRMIKTEEK